MIKLIIPFISLSLISLAWLTIKIRDKLYIRSMINYRHEMKKELNSCKSYTDYFDFMYTNKKESE